MISSLGEMNKHLSAGELPLTAQVWVKTSQMQQKDIDAAIGNLRKMIGEATKVPCKQQRDWEVRLEEIDELECNVAKIAGPTFNLDLDKIKSQIIEAIASKAIDSIKSDQLTSPVLSGLNALWKHSKHELHPGRTLLPKVTQLENTVSSVWKKASNVTNVETVKGAREYIDYLDIRPQIVKAIKHLDFDEFTRLVNSGKFPLDAPLNDQGETILFLIQLGRLFEEETDPNSHKNQILLDFIEIVLAKDPSLMDQVYEWANEKSTFNMLSLGKVTSTNRPNVDSFVEFDSLKENPHKLDTISSEDKARYIDLYPNRLTKIFQDAIQSKIPDSDVRRWLNDYSQVITGQRARSLLQTAVDTGNILIIKQILDLGVSPTGIYGKQLMNLDKADLTPLHQAAAKGYLDVVKLLLERGASADEKDEKGLTVVDYVRGDKDLSKNIPLRRVLEESLLEKKNLRQERFNLAFKEGHWEELCRMIKGKEIGPIPENILETIVSAALTKGQRYFVTLLIEQGYFQKASPATLALAVNEATHSWSIWFLKSLEAGGLDFKSTYGKQVGHALMGTALKNKNFPMAAFLYGKGVSLGQIDHDLESGIKEYAMWLEHGEKPEQDVRALINLKNLGHLVGDPIIKDMKDEKGNNLEGNLGSESMAFLSASVNLAANEHPALDQKALSHVCSTLDNAWKMAVRLESIQLLTKSEQVGEAVKSMEKDLLEEIQNLPDGQVICIPAGWNFGRSGHAIMVEFKRISRDQVEINVINTGEGAEFHGATSDAARHHLNTVCKYKMSLEDLQKRDVIRQIVELKSSTIGTPDYVSKELYGVLERYFVSETPIASDEEPLQAIRKTQFTGTCSLRCILAYCKLHLSEHDFKILKAAITENGLTFAIQQNEWLLEKQPTLSKLLSLAMPKAFHGVVKRVDKPWVSMEVEEERLGRLSATGRQLKEAIPPPVSEHECAWVDNFLNTKTGQLAQGINGAIKAHTLASIAPAKGAQAAKYVHPLATKEINEIETSSELIEYLDDLLEFTAKIEKVATYRHFKSMNTELQLFDRQITSNLISLGRAFLPNAAETPLTKAVGLLKNSPEACEKVISMIDDLTNRLCLMHEEVYSNENPGRSIALKYALVASWELASSIEELRNYPEDRRISTYGMKFIWSWQDAQRGSHPMFDPQLEEDLQKLEEYDAQLKANNSLFHTTDVKFTRHFELIRRNQGTPSGIVHLPDYHIAREYAALRTDWKEADESYYKQVADQRYNKQESGSDQIDKEEWRIYWTYAKAMPEHFNHLRRVAFLSSIELFGYQLPPALSKEKTNELGVMYSSRKAYPILQNKNYYGIDYDFEQPKELEKDIKPLPQEPGEFLFQIWTVGHKGLELELVPRNGQSSVIINGPDVSHRELMGIRCAIGIYPKEFHSPLAVPLLLDYFDSQYLTDLSQKERQVFFEFTLFGLSVLPAALKEIPNCAQELKEFLDKAIGYYEDKVTTMTDVSSSTATVAFLYTQWQRALSYIEHAGIKELDGTPIETLQDAVRTKIKMAISNANYQHFETQQQLSLALLESYQGPVHDPRQMTQDVIESIVAFNKNVQSNQLSKKLTPAFLNNAQTALLQKRGVIQNTLNDDPQFSRKLFNDCANKYGIHLPNNAAWGVTTFPIYACKVKGDLYEIDISNGKFMKNGLEPLALPLSMRESSDAYKELLGNTNLDVIDYDTYFESADGKMRIYLAETKGKSGEKVRQINEIQQLIDGKWYSYVSTKQANQHPPLPPFAGKDKLQIWLSADAPHHYLYVDRKSQMPVIKFDSDGLITFVQEDPKQRWAVVDDDEIKDSTFLSLDPSAILLQAESKDVPRKMRLQLPHLKDEGGQTVEFERRYDAKDKESRWVVRNKPHLFISEEQRIPGVRNFDNFVVLENKSGDREVLIPLKTVDELKNKEKKEIFPTNCISAAIKLDPHGNEILVTSNPEANTYLAYLTLTHAITPDDYELALGYLQGARKFERYTADELVLLGWIFDSNKSTHDNTAYSNAIRLFATWLVHDNFERYPVTQKYIPSQDYDEIFWKELPGNDDFGALVQDYIALQNHLPYKMRIYHPDNLSPQELMDWNLSSKRGAYSASYAAPMGPEHKFDNISNEDIELLRGIMSTQYRHTPTIDIASRPSEETLKKNFTALLDAARSKDPDRRRIAEQQLNVMQYDKKSVIYTYILGAALNPNASGAKELLYCVQTIATEAKAVGGPFEEANQINNWKQDLIKCLRKTKPYFDSLSKSVLGPKVAPVQVLPPLTVITLPDEIPEGEPLFFKPASALNIDRFSRLANKAFTVRETQDKGAEQPSSFEFETDDPWIKQCIEELNKDYKIGIEKNRQMPSYELKEDEVSIDDLLRKHREAISSEMSHYSDDVLTIREQAVLDLANKLPSDRKEALKVKAEWESGRRKPLEMRECVGLFLQGDAEGYRRATGLTNEEDIAQLHNMIGDYIGLHNKANRYAQVVNALDRLERVHTKKPRDEAKVKAALQTLAEELNVQTKVDPDEDPRALLVFEYGLNLTLKEHQVDGIRDMIKVADPQKARFRSVLLQRIQGGGKSLVFGHIMAQFKADGYHLSVHVPATAQYRTTIYDMSNKSDRLFGQRERTLEFDDDPLKFTPKYLTWMLNMLKETVVDRGYVSITNESLRAMRCKYLKTRFEIMNAPPGADTKALEESNQILKSILKLFRTRGIFTFDEMHLAFYPLKDLDMPYGSPSHANPDECKLLAKIVSLALLAQDETGPLLDIQHTAQLDEQKFKLACSQIIESLLKEPGWDGEGIREFISKEIDDLPSHLETPENKNLANLVILARQMLSDKWLKERLNMNVNEHHGLSDESGPRISVPYIANMKPAEGSEFSDRFVMTTNTLIAYMATGLNALQTKTLLKNCRDIADAEKSKMEYEGNACSLRDTPINEKFKAGTGLDLFSIDLDNPEDIQKVAQSLFSRKPETIELLLQFVINNEIMEVGLFDNQVSSNGQNVASIGQSLVAYSGSMENPNMAPVGSVAIPDVGTNGQTIDLLIRRRTEVNLVDDNVKSIFNMLLTSPDKDKIHAIIDVGAYFRGMSNEDVAKMICQTLRQSGSKIKGVLFFDTKKGNLMFMQRDPPNTVTRITKTSPEAIALETGFKNDELFTYYDQEHMTGVDIKQDDETIALMTMSEHTKIHEDLQGSRRLRQLDNLQKIKMVLPRTVVGKIESTLKKTYAQGEVPKIKDLLLYACIKEAEGQKLENMVFCMQKMENVVQQYILDKLYDMDVDKERELFKLSSYLFEKCVAVDLYKEYAHKRQNVPIMVYLTSIKNTFLNPLVDILPKEEIDALRKTIDELILNESTLKGLDKDIDVSHGFKPEDPQIPLTSQINETTRLAVKLQQDVAQKVQVAEQVMENQYLREIESQKKKGSQHRNDISFTPDEFFDHKFSIPADSIDFSAKKGCCWNLNQALEVEGGAPPAGCKFEDGLMITNNASMVYVNKTDLLGPLRKKPWSILVTSTYSEGKEDWKITLCSVDDARHFRDYLEQSPESVPLLHKRWLVRQNGKAISQPRGELPIEGNEKLSLMMTQALFFAGNFHTLSQKPWHERLKAWFTTMNEGERQKWIEYFENKILMGIPPKYPASRLYRFFHQK